jgi:rod shape-determining protein MreD
MASVSLNYEIGKTAVWFRMAGIVIITFLLQGVVLDSFTIGSLHVDITPLIGIAAGLVLGSEAGAITGFFSGLLFDTLVNTTFGISALVCTLCGFAAGFIQEDFKSYSAANTALKVAFLTAFYQIMWAIIDELTGAAGLFGLRFIGAVLLSCLVSAIFSNVAMRSVCRAVWSRSSPIVRHHRKVA